MRHYSAVWSTINQSIGGYVEPQEYDEILRNLVRIATHQDTINARLTAARIGPVNLRDGALQTRNRA